MQTKNTSNMQDFLKFNFDDYIVKDNTDGKVQYNEKKQDSNSTTENTAATGKQTADTQGSKTTGTDTKTGGIPEAKKTDKERIQETVGIWEKMAQTLDGKFFINVFDMGVSRGCSIACNVAGYQVKFTDYALTENEKDILSPFVNVIVVDLLKRAKPEHIFAFLLISIYGSKTANVLMTQKRLTKSDKTKLKEQNTEKRFEQQTGFTEEKRSGRGRPAGSKNKVK